MSLHGIVCRSNFTFISGDIKISDCFASLAMTLGLFLSTARHASIAQECFKEIVVGENGGHVDVTVEGEILNRMV